MAGEPTPQVSDSSSSERYAQHVQHAGMFWQAMHSEACVSVSCAGVL